MGVENGEHCLCGNEENYGKHGLCSAVGCHCHKRCLRDNTQICGDGWAISVYNLSMFYSVNTCTIQQKEKKIIIKGFHAVG